MLCSDEGTTIDVGNFTDMALSTIDIRANGGSDSCFFDAGGPATLSFNGGAGTGDLLEVTKFASGNENVVLDSNSMDVNSVNVATWSSTEHVHIHDKGVNDTISIQGVGTGISESVDAGEGVDTYLIGQQDIDANILGQLVIADGGHDDLDQITFVDTLGTSNDTYSLTAFEFTKTGMANPIQFIGAGRRLAISANQGNNTITIDNHILANLTVFAFGGNDTIHYGGGTCTGPTPAFNGGAGTDTIIFEDDDPSDTNITDKDYVIAGGIVDYIENGNLQSQHTYTAGEVITFNAGGYNSTFTVQEPTQTSLVINAGDGDDDMPFIPIATASSITFNGQNGIDALDIDDSSEILNATYTLAKTSYTKTGAGSINFGTIETLTVELHTATNTIDIDGSECRRGRERHRRQRDRHLQRRQRRPRHETSAAR
jgi:hypothetical protein